MKTVFRLAIYTCLKMYSYPEKEIDHPQPKPPNPSFFSFPPILSSFTSLYFPPLFPSPTFPPCSSSPSPSSPSSPPYKIKSFPSE